MKNIWLVGCGGIGALLAPVLNKLLPPDGSLVLWDGDRVTEENLDRQNFRPGHVGKKKADVLALILDDRVLAEPKFLTLDYSLPPETAIFAAVDNHPARRTVLSLADASPGSVACIAGNLYWDAEAYFYLPEWRNTKLDPRTYYPDLLTSNDGDPTGRHACTGAAQEASPQLATANMSAAAYAAWLFTFWTRKAPELPEDSKPTWPVHVLSNQARTRSITVGDKLAA